MIKLNDIYIDWMEGSRQTTPTNANTYDKHDPFEAFFDETENYKVNQLAGLKLFSERKKPDQGQPKTSN